MSLTALNRRILEISHKNRLSHISSSIGAAMILDEIYSQRRSDEPVILSAGHGGLGLYCVLEKYCGKNAEDLFARHGVHPNKNEEDEIFASTGSLGLGICISVGRALANRYRRVWCVISDGELREGAALESLMFAGENNLRNLQICLNANGYSAMREMSPEKSADIARYLCPWVKVWTQRPEDYGIPFLSGLDAHYKIMSDEDWCWVEAQEVVE